MKIINKKLIFRLSNLKTMSVLAVFFAFGFALPLTALAATSETNPFGNRDMSAPVDLSNAYMLPGIYATDLSFSQNGKTITGSFNTLNNEEETIGGLQYRIEVLDSQEALIAIHQSGEEMMLAPKEKRNIVFSYTLPALPAGAYTLRIQIVTNGGRLLGWSDSELKIENGVDNFIKISPVSVSLSEYQRQSFEPQAGPNISPSGNFSLKAVLKNIGHSKITVTPTLEIYAFDLVKGNAATQRQPEVTLNAGQEITFDFPVTAEKTPGVYSALLYFTDSNGNSISSIGEYRWVVRGASADILPMKINTLPALKGEQAVISVDVVGAPDAETVTNGNLKMQIIDDKGVAGFAEMNNIKLTDAVLMSVARINLTRDLASHPKISAEITDQNGNILAVSAVNIEWPKVLSGNKSNLSNTGNAARPVFSVAGIILLSLFFITFFLKRRGNFNFRKAAILALLVMAIGSVFIGKAIAAGNGNGIEVWSPSTGAATGFVGDASPVVELFINAPIHDAPAGTYQKNAVPLQYRIDYAVCANSISLIRVIGRFDLNGGKQTTLAGTNANWQVVHNATYSDDAAYNNNQTCLNGNHFCRGFRDFSGTLDLSSLPANVCTTTLQMVAKFYLSNWENRGAGNIPDDSFDSNDISFHGPSWIPTNSLAHGVNLWINFSCPLPIVANCSVTPTAANTGDTVTWSSSATGGTGTYAYSWTGDEGLSSVTASTTKVYSTIGTKSATVTVTSGSQTATATCHIPISAPPPATLTANCSAAPSTVNIGDIVSWSSTVSGGAGIYSYSWTGDDSLSGTTSSLNKSYSTAGVKNSTLVVTSGSQSVTKFCSVVVNAPPGGNPLSGTCSVTPSVVNTGDTVTWSSTATGGTGTYSYSWSGTDSLSGTTALVTKTYGSTGTKIGNVTITSGSDVVTIGPCRVSIRPPVGCTSNCGGGLNQPDVVLSSTTTLPSPIIATLTSAPRFVYLSQVPYTGFGDYLKLILFILTIALWSAVVVYLIKVGIIKKIIRRAFRNVENEPQFAKNGASSGFVFDVNNNRVLTMDMNPINSGAADVFVPKYNNVDTAQNKKTAESAEVNVPTAKDYGIVSEPASVSNSNGNVNKNNGGDLTTDVNAFVNLVVRGEEKPVMEFIRKIKDRGILSSDFAADVVLELDNAYRAKMAGETNRRNIVLSQIVSHWGGGKMESVMNGLFAIVENGYADNNLGTKVALMRIMRS